MEPAFDFLELAEVEYPSCLLLDVRLPDIKGFQLPKSHGRERLQIPDCFHDRPWNIPISLEAMKHEAVDFLPKPFEPDDLHDPIDLAMMRNVSETQKIRALIDALTPREKKVMRWVITACSTNRSPMELVTSEKTVKVHRDRVCRNQGLLSCRTGPLGRAG